MSKAALAPLPPVAAEAMLTSGPRILVADDEATARVVLTGLLSAAGYQVAEAEDGAQALRRARETRPDLLVLDVQMPIKNGFEVCRALRADPRTERIPVLILTGLEDEAAVERAFEAGATDFSVKPISPGLLLQRVRFLLRNADAIAQLRASEAALASALRIARLGGWVWHIPTDLFLLSREACALLGFCPDEQPGLDALLSRMPESDQHAFRRSAAMTHGGGQRMDLRLRISMADGSTRHFQVRGTLNWDPVGRPAGLRGTLQDITDRVDAEQRIHHLARFDQLTGLPNRAQFTEHLRVTVAKAARDRRKAALLLLDLNTFKRVNDAWGQKVGDAALTAVGARLQSLIRESDPLSREATTPDTLVARQGGDEFLLTLGDLERSEMAAVVAHRILAAFEEPFQVEGVELRLTASIGISVYPEDGTGEDLLRHAEEALGHARSNRSAFEFFDRELSRQVTARLALEDSLSRAVEQEEFTLFYQPQVDPAGRVIGAEALLRWFRPDGTLVPTGLIMPIIEQKGLLGKVVDWTLRTALGQMRSWDDLGLTLPSIAVNLGAGQLEDPHFAERVATLASKAQVAPERVSFEILERALVENPEAVATLSELRRRGFHIALDDFGTGYSALSCLRRFPIDTLKIDRSFLQDLPGDPAQAAILRAIVSLSKDLAIEPLGEGVETEAQRDFLLDAGCRALQGYLFGRPMAAADFAGLLSRAIERPRSPSPAAVRELARL